jgi:hypothetical protein
MSKPHLSHSQVSMYQRCGLQWQFRYIDGIKAPPGVSALVGKATHKSVEANLTAMMAGAALERGAVAAVAAESLAQAWADEPPMLTEDDGSSAVAEGAAVDKAVTLAELHHGQVAPKLRPAAVEQAFRIESDAWDFDILGFKDVVEVDGTVRDTKTSGKSPPADAATTSDQLGVYAWDAELAGKPAPMTALDYLVSTKVAKAVTLTAIPDAEDFARVARRFEAARAGMVAGVALPAARDSWVCCAKWCGYWDRCDHGAKHKTIVPVTRLARHVTPVDTRGLPDW